MSLSIVSKRVTSTPMENVLEKIYTISYLWYVLISVLIEKRTTHPYERVYQPRSPDEEPLPEPNRVAVKISSVDSPQFEEDVKIFVGAHSVLLELRETNGNVK